MVHDARVVPGTPVEPALDSGTLKYALGIHTSLLPNFATKDPGPIVSDTFDTTGLQAVLNEFGRKLDDGASSSNLHKSLKLKEDTDWMKLTPLSRNVIEGMRAYYTTEADDDEDEYIIIPSGMTIEMSAVIQCSTGARAEQYL